MANDLYFTIGGFVYSICTTLVMDFFYMVWIRPFLRKRQAVLICGVVYAAVMEVLILSTVNMTFSLAYGVGAMAVFLTMCLADRENVGQKLFLAVTFFCMRWQNLLITTCLGNELYLLISKVGAGLPDSAMDDKKFWLWAYVLQLGLELLAEVLLMYVSVRLMLWAYGRKREQMTGQELMILLVPSLSGVVAFEFVQYFQNIYEQDSGKNVYDIYGFYDWLLMGYSAVCFGVMFVMAYTFCQWKKERQEDKEREILYGQVKELKRHIGEVEQLYRDMRGLRHDMGNHLMTLEQLYGSGAYEEAEAYARALKREAWYADLEMAAGDLAEDESFSEEVSDSSLLNTHN